MIRLETKDDAVVLPVRAQPGARQSAVRGEHDAALKVCVTQVAEKGKANKAIIAVLCKQLGLRKSQIELLSGAAASAKKFLVREIDADELRRRIDKVLARITHKGS